MRFWNNSWLSHYFTILFIMCLVMNVYLKMHWIYSQRLCIGNLHTRQSQGGGESRCHMIWWRRLHLGSSLRWPLVSCRDYGKEWWVCSLGRQYNSSGVCAMHGRTQCTSNEHRLCHLDPSHRQWDINCKHIAGKDNHHADYQSRQPDKHIWKLHPGLFSYLYAMWDRPHTQ